MIDRHDRTLPNRIASFRIHSSGRLLVELGQRSHEAKSPRLPRSVFLHEVQYLLVPCFLRLNRGGFVDLDDEYGGADPDELWILLNLVRTSYCLRNLPCIFYRANYLLQAY
jgi:hypothetical protein